MSSARCPAWQRWRKSQWWAGRHITPKECARIQSFDVDSLHGAYVLGENDQQSYKQWATP